MMSSSRVLKLLIGLSVVCISYSAYFARAQYPGFDAPGTGASAGSTVGIAAVEKEVDGGAIPVGASSQVVLLFRNEGAQPVQTGKINLYPSSNVTGTVTLNQCVVEPLEAGAECAIAISVKGLQAGAWRMEMLMLHSGRSRLVTSTLSGSIELNADATNLIASDIETVPDEIDFGSLSTGQALVEPVLLRNIISTPVKIEDVTVSAAAQSGFEIESQCDVLQPGQACLATVKWSPQQKGLASGVLIVKHDGPTAVSSVPLTGDYNPDEIDQAEIFPDAVPGKGLLVASQTEIDFGEDIISASTITVSLVNTGDTSLTLKDIKIAGADGGLSFGSGGCREGLVLEPIEACPLTVTWSPTRVGEILDDVQVVHSGARGILVLPVRGNAEAIVSQDQKAIVLSKQPTKVIESEDVTTKRPPPRAEPQKSENVVVNASGALDGLKITSFSAKRAIVNGPGGSRLIFDKEPVMLGGVMWDVDITKSGIEFSQNDDRVLLLFDRSLSSLNRGTIQSSRDLSLTTNSNNTDSNDRNNRNNN